MDIVQKQKSFPFIFNKFGNFNKIKNLLKDEKVVRFSVLSFDDITINCEYAVAEECYGYDIKNIFEFNPRKTINSKEFNVVMTIPTGIGADVGGDSGDGNVAARLVGKVVDNLITHPNVVNAADINEMTENTLYVEGSILNRFIMGDIGLRPVRGNRILLIHDPKDDVDKVMVNLARNAASAARVTLGCDVDVLEMIDPPKYYSFFNENGLAVGKVTNLEKLVKIIEEYKNVYDSFVLYTILEGSTDAMDPYYLDQININPWGGIEAMITHSISNIMDVSIAHSPMFTSKDEIAYEFPVVNPVKSPETLSKTELPCTLKGMYKTPKIVDNNDPFALTNKDIHAILTPDKCIGIPVIAALEQNIPVIAIEDNKNLMKNDLSKLPWNYNQFFKVKNYYEAVGILMSLKYGISPNSLKRPMDWTTYYKK